MFNTSSTTITISRDNITTSAGSSECDQYVWSVTAINPAGSSLPTNSTTPVSFVSAAGYANNYYSISLTLNSFLLDLDVPSLNVCTSYNSSTLVITIEVVKIKV